MRFPGFTGEWEKYSNHELFNIISEKNKLSKGNVVLSASQIDGMIPRDSIGVDIKYEEENLKGYKIVKKGDYVIHLRSFQGGFAFSEIHGICSPAYIILRPNILLEYSFLKRYFTSRKFINSLKLVTYGIRDGKSISVEEWFKLKIFIPKKEEQQKIIAFLSLIDERIATQNKIIEKLESLIKGLNNYLHKKYGNDVETSLAKLGKSYNGLSGKSGDDFGMGKPYITYVNVYQNSIVDESMIGYVKISDEEKQNTICYGDALFTISSETPEEVGTSSVYLGENQELYLNSFCFGYRLDNFNILNPKYMPYCFSSYKFRKFVYPLAQGSTRFNLHMHHFMNKKFKIPTIQNQLRIKKLLDSFSEKLQAEKLIYSSLKVQKSYLLKQLFK